LLSFDSTDTPAALRYVAQQAERARIVAPAEIRDAAREQFRAILARHEGPPSEVPSRRAGSGGKGKR